MPASQAMIGYGCKFEIGENADSPSNFTELGEVTNITFPSATTDMVDVTHMQSPGGIREFVPGLIDPGECSFEMNFVPGSTAENTLNAILALAPSLRVRFCRITTPNSYYYEFLALLMTFEKTAPTDDKMTATVTFKVTGPVNRNTTP